MKNSFQPVSVHDKIFGNPFVSRQRHPFNDKRLFPVWENLSNRMTAEQSIVNHQLGQDVLEAERFYNFYNNPKVTVEELIKMNCVVKPENISNRSLLILGDSSSFNMGKRNRIRDIEKLGVLNDGKTSGFNTHVNLVLSADQGQVLGLGDIIHWYRKKAKKSKKNDKATTKELEVRWEQKESYRWVLGASNAHKVTENATERTFIFDSEADSFKLMSHIADNLGDHFIIRSKHDRILDKKGKKQTISDVLAQSDVLGSYEIELRELDHYSRTAGKRIKRKARKANLELKAELLEVPEVDKSGNETTLKLYVVEAREVLSEELPEGESPVLWRLLTTHPVLCFEDAQRIVQHYTLRWIIEQFFRTLKKKGFAVEDTQLETAAAVVKQTTMAMKAACTVLQLVYARNDKDAQPTDEVFSEKEQQVLHKVNEHFEGISKKKIHSLLKN